MKTTTKRRGTDFRFLKSIIIVGSLLATLIGSDLLAKQSNESQSIGGNPTMQNASEQSTVNLDGAPIVHLVIPKPIVNSRSSK